MESMMQEMMFEISEQSESNQPYRGKYIYETKGRAREYMELACKLYNGCDHGCAYCYAPDIMKRDRLAFSNTVTPRADIVSNLEKDARKYVASGDKRQVLFCFACDPYCKANDHYGLTRQAIIATHNAGMPVCILTKGGKRSLKDIDLFTPEDAYAVTLTCYSDEQSLQWEPGAAVTSERI